MSTRGILPKFKPAQLGRDGQARPAIRQVRPSPPPPPPSPPRRAPASSTPSPAFGDWDEPESVSLESLDSDSAELLSLESLESGEAQVETAARYDDPPTQYRPPAPLPASHLGAPPPFALDSLPPTQAGKDRAAFFGDAGPPRIEDETRARPADDRLLARARGDASINAPRDQDAPFGSFGQTPARSQLPSSVAPFMDDGGDGPATQVPMMHHSAHLLRADAFGDAFDDHEDESSSEHARVPRDEDGAPLSYRPQPASERSYRPSPRIEQREREEERGYGYEEPYAPRAEHYAPPEPAPWGQPREPSSGSRARPGPSVPPWGQEAQAHHEPAPAHPPYPASAYAPPSPPAPHAAPRGAWPAPPPAPAPAPIPSVHVSAQQPVYAEPAPRAPNVTPVHIAPQHSQQHLAAAPSARAQVLTAQLQQGARKGPRFSWFVAGAAFGILFAFFATGFFSAKAAKEEAVANAATQPPPAQPQAAQQTQAPPQAAPQPLPMQQPVAQAPMVPVLPAATITAPYPGAPPTVLAPVPQPPQVGYAQVPMQQAYAPQPQYVPQPQYAPAPPQQVYVAPPQYQPQPQQASPAPRRVSAPRYEPPRRASAPASRPEPEPAPAPATDPADLLGAGLR